MMRVSASTEDYMDFSDMGNYDHSVQRNIDKKISEYGMIPDTPRDFRSLSTTPNEEPGACDSTCIRSLEYLQRIVKSLLRQMRVNSHVFGPGEAITIDLQAELKYDDYITLTKFSNSKDQSDKYLYRIDEIMSNFIHVVEHSSSRLEFLENIIHFPAFYSLKFWLILLTSSVICSLIVMLLVKAYNTRAVHVQMLYGFLIIFILSCVWSFSNMYEDKKAEIHAHMVQSNGLPPKDCDYHNMQLWDSFLYFFRVNIFGYKDRCSEHYSTTMTDPFWKVNPMEAISSCVAFFMFKPMDYIGGKLGSFYVNFVGSAPLYLKPVMLCFAIFVTVLLIYGPFRISTPLLTIEPAWHPQLPALERHPISQQVHAIGHERIRNEIMERPDGPVVKSVRDATTDMDGFQEYLTDEGTDELEIIGPFARFSLAESRKKESTVKSTSSAAALESLVAKNLSIKCENVDNISGAFRDVIPKMEEVTGSEDLPTKNDDTFESLGLSTTSLETPTRNLIKQEPVECIPLPIPAIKLIKEELLRDALRETEKNDVSSENILP